MRKKRHVIYFKRDFSTESYLDFIERIEMWIEDNDVLVVNLDRIEMSGVVVFYEFLNR